MVWGFYVWPRCDLGLDDRCRALVRQLRDLAEPVVRIHRWISEVMNAMAALSALLVELFRSAR